jgi:hypothetical protein
MSTTTPLPLAGLVTGAARSMVPEIPLDRNNFRLARHSGPTARNIQQSRGARLFYSYLRATIGSTRIALRAGM